ncbi:MAG: hypothetical protein RLZZ59_222 [Pseudomonadota bacterium]|jgi:uroporphyrinogen-III synthase
MRKKGILLTRSIEENFIASNWLVAKDFKVFAAPMIEYERCNCDFSSFADVRDIIITSKFSAKLIAENYMFEVEAWVVGEESAKILTSNPKIKLNYVAESVTDLIDNYVHRGHHSERIMYFSGSSITMDIPFSTRYILYKSNYTDSIPEDVISAIDNGIIDIIMLYSKNCATNLLKLFIDYGLSDRLEKVVVVAISEEVGRVMSSYVGDVLVPEHHNSEEMLKMVEDYAKRN